MWSFQSRHAGYHSFDDFNKDGLVISQEKSQLKYKRALWVCSWAFVTALTAMLAGHMGYQIGSKLHVGVLAPLGEVESIFEYQKAFTRRPNNESNLQWDALMPEGMGFVSDPKVAPKPVGLAVFHQLHCLDAIRQSYYAALDGEPISDETANPTLKPGHVRHCIDYIRQSLMCHADPNAEQISEELHGVTGWGSHRKCRDFWGLVKYAGSQKA